MHPFQKYFITKIVYFGSFYQYLKISQLIFTVPYICSISFSEESRKVETSYIPFSMYSTRKKTKKNKKNNEGLIFFKDILQ